MSLITISKNEYANLKLRANAYERMLLAAQGDFSLNPPERSRKKVLAGFKSTGKYSKEFLDALKRGLSRSSYFET